MKSKHWKSQMESNVSAMVICNTVYITALNFNFDSGFFLAQIACIPSACLCANVPMPIMTDLFLSLNLPFTGRQPANE